MDETERKKRLKTITLLIYANIAALAIEGAIFGVVILFGILIMADPSLSDYGGTLDELQLAVMLYCMICLSYDILGIWKSRRMKMRIRNGEYFNAKSSLLRWSIIGFVAGGVAPGAIFLALRFKLNSFIRCAASPDSDIGYHAVNGHQSSLGPINAHQYLDIGDEAEKARRSTIEQLSSAISIMMPEFIDAGTSAQVTVTLKNASQIDITDLHVDISDMEEYFEVKGEVNLKTLKPGVELENHIVIKPKYPKGLFPVKVWICSGDVRVERDFTIKVGGTEIY